MNAKATRAAVPQLAMVVDDPRAAERELEAEATADHIMFVHMIAACRDVALTTGYDKAANALDAIWSRHGRPVSASFLRAALNPDSETRSYFRLEWVQWFARQSADVRELLLGVAMGDGPKDPKDELDDLKEVMRVELGKVAEKLIQKGKAPRRR
jgi:hypothetical protein